MLCGGGARLPAIAARAARAGLSGIEFGVNIPGTLGGAVRMNANAYGGELGQRARVGRARRPPRASRGARPASWGSPTAARTWRRARSSRAPRCCSPRATARPVAGDARGDAPAPPRGPAAGDQDVRLDLQEPGRPAGRAAAAPGCCSREAGCNGAGASAARASRPSTRTSSRTRATATTADVVAVMAEGRRRVLEPTGVELEPEVQTLGDVRFPWR